MADYGLNSLLSQIPEDPNLVLLASKFLDRIHSNAVPLLQKELDKKNLVLTEKLKTSLNRTVKVMYQDKIVEMILEMDEHGKFVDYKTLRYTGRPPVNDFIKGLEAALKKGKITLHKVPGYRPGVFPINRDIAIRRIAAATVVKISQQATVRRPSSRSDWFKKFFKDVVGPMEGMLQNLAAAVAIKEAENISKKLGINA